ncbi:MAG: hypothetical protein NT105_00290 [Verrucomicrobia bacterium]|nr:hypothetical protein [Verrucomicrobiota bacterium]
MPATIITTETLDPSIDRASIDREIELRIKAGAIRSWVDETAPKWTLKTEWNVIGENGPAA